MTTSKGFRVPLFLLTLLLLPRLGVARQAEPVRPNVLIIYTDDQRADAAGYASGGLVHTPHLDALAARGVRFTNAFVTLSVCSPSRAAMLTGRYGSANGVLRVGAGAEIDADEQTLAHLLKEVGYRTGHVGKWHLKNSPASLGFDEAAYFTSNGRYYGRAVTVDGEPGTYDGFIESFNADHAIRFLEAAAAEAPFLLVLNTQVPHMNHEHAWPAREATLARYDQAAMPLPPTWDSSLEGKPPYLKTSRSRTQARDVYGYDDPARIRDHAEHYYAVVTEMDTALGRVLGALERLGLQENTYVVFMSDNGWMLGEHGFTSKVLPYEASIRVPLVVAGPGLAPRDETRMALNIDLLPTVLEWADVRPPANLHGESLVPLLQVGGADVPWRTSFFYEAPEPQLGSWPLLAVRTERWKYVKTFDLEERDRLVFEELYDLRADPYEARNLAKEADYVAVRDSLRAELGRLRADVRARP